MTRQEALDSLLSKIEDPENYDDAISVLSAEPEVNNAREQELENELAEARRVYRERWGESDAGANTNPTPYAIPETNKPEQKSIYDLSLFSADTE